jgi:hypothetical protein
LFGIIGCCAMVITYVMSRKITTWGIEEFSLFSIFPMAVFFFLFGATRFRKNILGYDKKNGKTSVIKELTGHAEKHLS